MKNLLEKLLRQLVASLLVFSALNTYSAQAENELIVLSYNIHHGAGTDGSFDLSRIAAIIKQSKAQLVALQEIDVKTKRVGGTNVALELGRLTGMQVAFGPAMDYQGGKYGQAILSVFPLTNIVTHQLPQREKREPRIAVEATVKIGSPARELTFVSTHLDHEIEEIRVEQATKLNELFARENKWVLLAGDFNSRPESKTMQTIFAQWKDASEANPAPTIPAGNPRNRIDYILFRPQMGWATVESKVLDEPIASDHRPVLVKLKQVSPPPGQ